MTKRYHDWYKLQKDAQGWKNLNPDIVVAEKLKSMDLTINFDYCHYGLRNMLVEFECDSTTQPDFYIITDLELSKKSLPELFDFYHDCYKKSRVGIYLAALSYYLEPDIVDPTLQGPYSKNIANVFEKKLNFATQIENFSTVMDYPIIVANQEKIMREGANYIFVHPNIRYFLWK
jgi:hypothetical protein